MHSHRSSCCCCTKRKFVFFGYFVQIRNELSDNWNLYPPAAWRPNKLSLLLCSVLCLFGILHFHNLIISLYSKSEEAVSSFTFYSLLVWHFPFCNSIKKICSNTTTTSKIHQILHGNRNTYHIQYFTNLNRHSFLIDTKVCAHLLSKGWWCLDPPLFRSTE